MVMKLITPPDGDVVTLDEVKAHLRVDHTDDDELIEALIDAAVETVDGPDGAVKLALLDQTWDLFLDAFPCPNVAAYGNSADLTRIDLPLSPIIEVVGVFYTNSSGGETELDAATYGVDSDSEPPRITLASGASWPTAGYVANAVRIRFRAGHLDDSSPPVANVPNNIKVAIKIFVEDMYENRGTYVIGQTVSTLPDLVERLLRKSNKHRGMA